MGGQRRVSMLQQKDGRTERDPGRGKPDQRGYVLVGDMLGQCRHPNIIYCMNATCK